jgi:hypothetical protein
VCATEFDRLHMAIKYDEQFLKWFELNLESGIMCVYAKLKHFDGILQFSPTIWCCHPKVRKRMIETIINPPLNFTHSVVHLNPHKLREPQIREPQRPKRLRLLQNLIMIWMLY